MIARLDEKPPADRAVPMRVRLLQARLFLLLALVEESGALVDIPDSDLALAEIPSPPPGCAIAGVDIVVRVRRLPQKGG